MNKPELTPKEIKAQKQTVADLLTAAGIQAEELDPRYSSDMRDLRKVEVQYLTKSRSWVSDRMGLVIRVTTTGSFRTSNKIQDRVHNALLAMPQILIRDTTQSEQLKKRSGWTDVRGTYHHATAESNTFSWFVDLVEPLTSLSKDHLSVFRFINSETGTTWGDLRKKVIEGQEVPAFELLRELRRNGYVAFSDHPLNWDTNVVTLTEKAIIALAAVDMKVQGE